MARGFTDGGRTSSRGRHLPLLQPSEHPSHVWRRGDFLLGISRPLWLRCSGTWSSEKCVPFERSVLGRDRFRCVVPDSGHPRLRSSRGPLLMPLSMVGVRTARGSCNPEPMMARPEPLEPFLDPESSLVPASSSSQGSGPCLGSEIGPTSSPEQGTIPFRIAPTRCSSGAPAKSESSLVHLIFPAPDLFQNSKAGRFRPAG